MDNCNSNSEGLVRELPSVFSGQISAMEGELFKIVLMENAQPFSVTAPLAVFLLTERNYDRSWTHFNSKISYIAPVAQPTEWRAPIVVAPKKGTDDIRLCVDLPKLNRYVCTERYQSPTPAEAVADIATTEAQVFTILDTKKGYHQCLMDEQSELLTTFLTPFGRFKYKQTSIFNSQALQQKNGGSL